MNALLGWDIKAIIIVTSVAIIFYSMLGGLKAVIWTEAIQGFILIGGAIICMLVLMFNMPEGPKQMFDMAVADNKFSLGSFGTSLSDSTFGYAWFMESLLTFRIMVLIKTMYSAI